MKFLILTGKNTDTDYFINPNRISSFYKYLDHTRVYTDRIIEGITMRYEVTETPIEILAMIEGLESL